MRSIVPSFSWFTIFFFCISIANLSAQAPTVTSFTPASGSIGTLVTINGMNLGDPTAISIGSVAAIIVSKTSTKLVAMVMPGASTGEVSVTIAACLETAVGNFSIIATPYPSVQQGAKLVGIGAVGIAGQGQSVAISSDGNTAIVGGVSDNGYAGAAWVYTRSGASRIIERNVFLNVV